MRGTTKTLLTWFGVAAFVACVAVAHARAQHEGNPFIDHGDRGETVHVLPAPAVLHNPRVDQPTEAATGPGVYPASYGSGNLIDHGGPEIPKAGFRAVYWNASVAASAAYGSTLQNAIDSFVATYSNSVDYTIIQQYGSHDPISASLINAGSHVYSQATQSRISDGAIQRYLASLFAAGQEIADASTIYGLYFPSGMKIALQGGTSCSTFCGYHSHFTYGTGSSSKLIKYAVFPYTNCRACSLSGKSVADIITIVTSHEIREAVTDSLGTAWWDSQGYEADDKCAWHNLYQTNAGYWVQPEYSNAKRGCVVP